MAINLAWGIKWRKNMKIMCEKVGICPGPTEFREKMWPGALVNCGQGHRFVCGQGHWLIVNRFGIFNAVSVLSAR